MENVINFKDIVNWFIEKYQQKFGELPSFFVANAFLFYAKGFYYVFEDENLFDGKFLNKKFGFILKEFNFDINEQSEDGEYLKNAKAVNNEIILTVLEFVFNLFLNKSESEIFEIEKNEEISLNNPNEIIDDEIKKYFQNSYLSDDIVSGFNISHSDIVLTMSFIKQIKYKKAFKVLAK